MDEHQQVLTTSCNCLRNTCCKCYCQCFNNGRFCSNACNCQGCWNREHRRTFVEEHAELRLNTKPSAASQSKGLAPTGEQRMHVKGCTCNKSGCKKKYCECFKKQIACTTRCKCQGCENSYGRGGKGLQENGADGSSGGSNESVVVTDEELLRPTQAAILENVAATADPQDSGFLASHEVGWHSLPTVQTLTHETPTMTTRRIPMQVEIDEAGQLQNIGTWH